MQSQVPRILHSPTYSEIFAYPSSGGLVRKRITRVELDWLTTNQKDDLALRIMQLGGHWWPDKQLYERHSRGEYTYGHHYPPDLDVGYPSTGGVVVLKIWAENSPYCNHLSKDTPIKSNECSRLGLCRTMDERCDVLLEFGAKKYDYLEECPDIPATLEEGIATGKEYETLLRKMEEREYLDEWLNSL